MYLHMIQSGEASLSVWPCSFTWLGRSAVFCGTVSIFHTANIGTYTGPMFDRTRPIEVGVCDVLAYDTEWGSFIISMALLFHLAWPIGCFLWYSVNFPYSQHRYLYGANVRQD